MARPKNATAVDPQEAQRIIASAPSAAVSSELQTETPEPVAARPEYDKWRDELPSDYRQKLEDEIANRNAQGLFEYYGEDITNLLALAKQDEGFKKKLSRMNDKEYRDWILDNATGIYDSYDQQRSQEARVDPNLEKINSRLDKMDERQQQERAALQQQRYLEDRKKEYATLLNTFPELQFAQEGDRNYKRLLSIIEEAEQKHISYADSYQKFRDMWQEQEDNPAPRPAPRAQATTGTPPKPQAPRTKVEARQAMKNTLDKYGSIFELQAALRK